ncbi:MAG: TrwC relaxase, partial [Jatrophihabitantaceae bacterium]
ADLGPAHAAHLAAREAERYACLRPLEHVLGELREAWTIEANAQQRLEDATHRRELLRDIVAITDQRDAVVPPLHNALDHARRTAEDTAARLRSLEPVVTGNAEALAATLKSEWETQRQAARDAAQTVRHGSGRLGQRRGAVRDAHEHLEGWAQTWRTYLPAMPTGPDQVVSFAAWFDDTPRHHQAFDAYARTAAENAHPDYLPARDAAQDASQAKTIAWQELRETERHSSMALQHHGILGTVDDPHAYLADVEKAIASDTSVLTRARDQIAALRAEPALRAHPDDVVDTARDLWTLTREQRASWLSVRAATEHEAARAAEPRSPGWGTVLEIRHDEPEHGISR